MTQVQEINLTDIDDKLFRIFFPYAAQRLAEVEKNKTRFVHYTSAANAAQILQTGEFWMRQPSCMNDFREVEHGIEIIANAYEKTDAGKKFQLLLNDLQPGLAEQIYSKYLKFPFGPRVGNYIACISEHLDREDKHGRLSMWRAYGSGAGVALVLNPQPILNGPGILTLSTSPVAYFDSSDFERELQRINQNIQENEKFLRELETNKLLSSTLSMLRTTALSSKHPGFEEEREWRLIYSPSLLLSQYMKSAICAINGVPQNICKIPLHSIDNVATGGELPNLIDRIIIGPTEYPGAMYSAFVGLLIEHGVPDPEKKLSSQIFHYVLNKDR